MTAKELADVKPTIELQKLMKREGLVASGGEAKYRIQGGEVMVNGTVETRRRRQLCDGDVVEIHDERVIVVVDPDREDGDLHPQ